MTVLDFKVFMRKIDLKDDTLNETQLQTNYNYPIYPRDSKIDSDTGFVSIGDRNSSGSHWKCFIVKDKKSFYFDSFGRTPDKFLLNQLPKPTIYHNYKLHDKNSKLCGTYCLYFFFLLERMKYYDAILKLVFE